MLLAAGTDFVQIAIYAAVLIAGLLGALLQKSERDKQRRGAEPPAPQRGRAVPRSGPMEPEEPIIILPPEHRPVPPLPPAPPRPAPPRRDRLEGDTTRSSRPVAVQPGRIPRAQPVGERPTPQRISTGRTARAVREERPPSRRTPPQPPAEAAVAEEAGPAGPRRTALPVGGLVRALLARRDGVAAAFVVSEILAPPVSLRENDPMRLI